MRQHPSLNLTLLRQVVSVSLLLLVTLSTSRASPTYFDNASQQFYWRTEDFYYRDGYTQPDVELDPGLPITQSGARTTTTFAQWRKYAEPLTLPGWYAVTGGSDAQIASLDPIVVGSGSSWYPTTIDPVQSMGSGDEIGPSLSYQTQAYLQWIQDPSQVNAPTQFFIDTDAFIGIRINKPDGWHYGWIHLVYDGSSDGYAVYGSHVVGYRAMQWALESMPDTAVTIPEPSAAALLIIPAIALANLTRFRRDKKPWQ